MAKPNTMKSMLIGMNAILILTGMAMLGLAFGASLKSDIALMSQHPLFSTGMNCLSTATISSLLLFFTGQMPKKIKIDRSSRK